MFFRKNVLLEDRANTLIFIDEIQETPIALQQLRYFYEETPDLSVIAAGSMLESLFNPDISFPVGRMEYLVIRPASFSEFLGAMEEKAALQQLFMDIAPHNMALRLYSGEVNISTITTPGKKKVYLLSLPCYLVSKIEDYMKWFGQEIKKK